MNEVECLINDIAYNQNQLNVKTSVIKLVCYFNLFECYLSELGIDHWYNFHKKYKVNDDVLNNFFDFFYKRYLDNNVTNKNFTGLCEYVKDEYKKNLENNLKQKKNKLKTLLSISYYFRNNLYHGHKALCELDKYTTCFEKISETLKIVMENAKEKNNG